MNKDKKIFTNKFINKEENKLLLKNEFNNSINLKENPNLYEYLYPNLDDPNFNIKIAQKKEFSDTKYDGTIYDIKSYVDSMNTLDFELSPHQAFVRNFMSFQTPYNSLLLYHGLGTGKCHAKGTPIIMYDGNIKLVEDIVEGDLLMGDDSLPRTVLSLARGIDKMFKVTSNKGESYTVNEEHILCLKVSGFPKISRNNHKSNTNFNIQWIENNKFNSKTFTFNKLKQNEVIMKLESDKFYEQLKNNSLQNNNIIEISVKDYLNLSNKKKDLLKGYKVPIEFIEKELPFDPYMIGYWLGDGTSRDSAFTCQDSTVLYYFAKNLPHYKLSLFHRKEYTYGISGSGKVNGNKFLSVLKNLNLINNKHIPFIYKYNSRENRLKLLAGLLDSDGYLNKDKNIFEFTQKYEKIMDDIIYLARSLGFGCYKANKSTSWTYKNIKKYGNAFRINISGKGLEEIPTKIPRKQANPRKQFKDVLVNGINVEYVGKGDYYGFTLDGNCRYVMGDFTVTHNTCSAIGVAEEMRDYLIQMGISKKIIIVASPNVQDNFKLQLFDERKLKLVDGIWTIKGCIGNKLLKEINPTNMIGLSKEKIISEVKNLINISYDFMGYTQFSNKITKTAGETNENSKQRNLQLEFNNRLIIIDEVHNMRISDDNEKHATTAKNLMYLVSECQNIRLLLLSATPMFNNYKEIIWLINLMNINDKRGFINIKDIFDKDGNFKKNMEGIEIGKELLIRKVTGYISYVRGDNPYTFPFRIYPNIFAPENTFQNINEYPKYQLNCKRIPNDKKINKISLYLNKIGDYQDLGYKYVMNYTRKQHQKNFLNKDSFGYTDLQIPLECLNIVYPVDGLQELVDKIEPCVYVNDEATNPDIEINRNYNEDDLDEDNNVLEILNDVSSSSSISKLQTLIKSNVSDNKRKYSILSEHTQVPTETNTKTLTHTLVDTQTHTLVPTEPELNTLTHTLVPTEPELNTLTHTLVPTEMEINTLTHTLVPTEPEINTHTLVDSNIISNNNVLENEKNIENEEFEILVPIKRKSKRESVIDNNLIIGNNVIVTNVIPETSYNNQKGGLNIDPRILTGTLGLHNTMSYTDSTNQKGSFDYKNKNQRIFSPNEIGKYSCKIKSICENIYNSKTNYIAKGIILIYSAYIDGGLIPMALALEEMGITRFQNPKANAKTPSLFTKPPTEPVDVRTMKPKIKNSDFKPVKYIMITGDPRISPNNDLDVKAITSDDNINGENIKIVLISQAGSEGLDFKAIRQTHIMDPWYNMNRIEQITGRAVRNLSHKDIPFDERNVEIFLHGTILNNPEEESVDLYIYRIAELKSVQIGKITRLLKQTSVDCIINHEQSEFTIANFNKIEANRTVKQILSDGKVIENYQIGDMPNSAVCDYMDTCEYKCLPDITIEESKLNFDSYNETFMLVNSDKIIQKIRELMKERYFYTKKELFSLLNNPKPYPTSQIYAALTQMINDTSEYIIDRYDRTGYLINIGEYYLFQPSELNYNNISIYDRSVPIDYKHSMIKIDIKSDLLKNDNLNTNDNLNINDNLNTNDNINKINTNTNTNKIKELSILNENTKEKGKSILQELINNYEITKTTTKVTRGEDNWYKYCGIVIYKMHEEGIPINILQDDLIDHMLDSLLENEKIELLNYLNINCKENNLTKETDLFIIKIKKYFCDKIIHGNNITAIILFDGPSRINNLKVYILKNNKWINAEPEDIRDISPFINDKYKLQTNLNTFVGFMGFEDKNKYMIFKVKDTSKVRHTGSRCDQAGKKKTIDLLNDIIGEKKYTKENTRGIVQQELCILQEFILRNNERNKKDGKTWFLNTELAVINDL